MSSTATPGSAGGGQIAAESSREGEQPIERDDPATLENLNGQNGYRFLWFAPPSMPALRSDLNQPQSASTRDSDASKSTWSNVSSYFGSRSASTATSPPTSTDFANTFGSSQTALHRPRSNPTPPPVSRFSTSSAEILNSFTPPNLQDDDVPQTAHQKIGLYDLVQEKVKSIPFRKIFSHKWSKQAQAGEVESDHKLHVEDECVANRRVLLGLSSEDRFAMAIIAAGDQNQHALFTTSPTCTTSPSLHQGNEAGLLVPSAPTEGNDSLGDSFSLESFSPRRSKQRASYQSVQSSASHDSNSAGTRPDPYLCPISIYLPRSNRTRWVDTDGDFDSRSDNSHISPIELQELGIDVALDLAVSRALQRLGIKVPPGVVVPTTCSAVNSSGEVVTAQGRITLTWKAHMGEGYHTNVFFVGPETAPYRVVIGKDYLVPSMGEPRMKLCLVNYRNRKNDVERNEINRARRRQDSDVVENERDKQLYAASQHFNSLPLVVPPSSVPPQRYPVYQPQQSPQPSPYFPSKPHLPPMYNQSQDPSATIQFPSSQPPLSVPLHPNYQHHTQQQPYLPLSNPPWAQLQPTPPEPYARSTPSAPQQPSPPNPYTPKAYSPSAQQQPKHSQQQPYPSSSYHPPAPQHPRPRLESQQDSNNWPHSGWI